MLNLSIFIYEMRPLQDKVISACQANKYVPNIYVAYKDILNSEYISVYWNIHQFWNKQFTQHVTLDATRKSKKQFKLEYIYIPFSKG